MKPYTRFDNISTRTARPRDFVDIHTVMANFPDLNLNDQDNRRVLALVFDAKRVPIDFLGQIQSTYDQHVSGWEAVQASVSPTFTLHEFTYYFEFITDLATSLHPLGDM